MTRDWNPEAPDEAVLAIARTAHLVVALDFDGTASELVPDPMSARAVPEIYALPSLSDRVALNITDALICQYLGEERSLLHYSAILNQLRFSRDPVALDILSLQELDRQRKLANAPEVKSNRDLYDNAALLELGINDPKKIDIINLQ